MEQSITELILEWQALGEHECFARLVHNASPVIDKVAARWLKRLHMHTAVNVDEVRSRVLDHLRRLHAQPKDDKPVACFRPEPDGTDTAGIRYVCWLARRRTQDVVRMERRRIRRQPTYTEARITASNTTQVRNGTEEQDERSDALRSAMTLLRPVDRQVLEKMLEGQSQRAIADLLGVSEGNISRHKTAAISRLRCLLRTTSGAKASGNSSVTETTCKNGEARMTQISPFVTVQYQVRRESDAVFRRRYNWFAFGCLIEGAVDLTWVRKGRQQTSHQAAGACNFFAPDEADNEFLWQPASPTTFHALLVAPEYFAEVASTENVTQPTSMSPCFGFYDPAIESTIRSIRRSREVGDELAQDCDGRSLVICMLERQGHGKVEWLKDESRFTTAEARQICDYIDAHLGTRITLKHLAQGRGLSPGHFNRKCRHSFGVTPSRLVAVRRIQRVVDLLRRTSDPVDEIARLTGFCSPSHCTNTFRSILGMPPSRFRAEVRGEKTV